MSDESVSWMLVTSSQTRIDTEALVDVVLSMRKIKDACDEQLNMLAGMIQDLRIHKCGEAADHFYSLGAHLSERMDTCAKKLAYVARIHSGAEADVRAYQRTCARLDGGLGVNIWGGGLVLSQKIGRFGKYLNPNLPFLMAPVGLVHGGAVVAAHGYSFVHQANDAELGIRTQYDVGEVARMLSGTNSHENAEVTRDAAAQASTFYAAMGWLMFGRHRGVKVSAQTLPATDGEGAASRTRVLEGVADGGKVRTYCGPFGVALYAAHSVIAYPKHTPTVQQGKLGIVQGGNGEAPPNVNTPLQASAALERIGELRSSADEGQIEILQHVTTDEQGQERRSWSVMIRGTQKWGPGEDNPQDMLTNLQAVGQSDSDQLRAVKTAMDMAGIRSDEPVEFMGHSQGGIIAAQLASESDIRARYSVASVLTAGSPVAGFHPDPGVPMLNMENTRDIVPALDGAANTNRGNALTLHFDSEHLDVKQGSDNPIAAHDIGTYTQAIRECEQVNPQQNPNIGEVIRWEEQRRTRLGITDTTQTRSYIFDTRRVT